MKPIIRTIVAVSLLAISIAPIAVRVTHAELNRGEKTQAEALRSHRLTAIAKEKLSNNFYTATNPLVKGSIVDVKGLPRSVAINHGTDWGFLEVYQGQVRIVEVFAGDAVSKAASQVINPPKQ